MQGSRVAQLRQELNSGANQFLTNDVAAWQLNQSRREGNTGRPLNHLAHGVPPSVRSKQTLRDVRQTAVASSDCGNLSNVSKTSNVERISNAQPISRADIFARAQRAEKIERNLERGVEHCDSISNDIVSEDSLETNETHPTASTSKSTTASSGIVKQVKEKTDLLKRKTEQTMVNFGYRLSDIESTIERLEHASTFNFDGFQEKAREDRESTTRKMAALEVKATQLESTIRKIEHQRTFEKQGEVVDSNKDRDERITKLEKAITDLSFQLNERVQRDKVEESIIKSSKKRELETHNALAEMRDAIFRQERLLDQMRMDQSHKYNRLSKAVTELATEHRALRSTMKSCDSKLLTALSEIETEFDHHRMKISSLEKQLDAMNASIRRDTDRLMHTFSSFVLGPTHQRDGKEPVLTEIKNSPAPHSAAPPESSGAGLFEYSGARAVGKAIDSVRSSPSPDATFRSASNLASQSNARNANHADANLHVSVTNGDAQSGIESSKSVQSFSPAPASVSAPAASNRAVASSNHADVSVISVQLPAASDLQKDDVFVERFKSILEGFPERIQRAVADEVLHEPLGDRRGDTGKSEPKSTKSETKSANSEC